MELSKHIVCLCRMESEEHEGAIEFPSELKDHCENRRKIT
jgi:hypothetical protein